MLGRHTCERGYLASTREPLDVRQFRQQQGGRKLSNGRDRLEEFPLTLQFGMPIDVRLDLLPDQPYLLIEVGDRALQGLQQPLGRRAFESVGVLMLRLLHRVEVPR